MDVGAVLPRADDEDGGEGREARRDVDHDAAGEVDHLPPPPPPAQAPQRSLPGGPAPLEPRATGWGGRKVGG